MDTLFFDDERFERIDFTQKPLSPGEYDHCEFTACNLSDANLSGIRFIGCTFSGCNLSMANLSKTSFQEVVFKECKMLGLHFENCDPFLFTVSFHQCQLNLASWYGMKMKKTLFRQCSLREADLSGADLSEAVLDHCDLTDAVFDRTTLEKADLRHSYGFSIDPENNRLKKAKFSRESLEGLLYKYHLDIE